MSKKDFFCDEPSDLLAIPALLEGVYGAPLPFEFSYLPVATSTNDEAKWALKRGCPHGSIWVAESQTAGRGRQGRSWLGSQGRTLMMSLVLRPKDITLEPFSFHDLRRLPKISIACGVALALSIRKWHPALSPKLKWPNDLWFRGRKVAGILVESIASPSTIEGLVVGVGVNVFDVSFDSELKEKATSLLLECLDCETEPSKTRADLAVLFYSHLMHYAPLVLREGLAPLSEMLNELDLLNGQYLEFECLGGADPKTKSPTIEVGTARGIDEEGRLRVERPSGQVTLLSSGDMHLRSFTPSRFT